MEIVRALAGYSYGRSDLVRRAMSKKKHDVMAKEREYFVHGTQGVVGAVKNGVPEQVANRIFDEMMDFASYAFKNPTRPRTRFSPTARLTSNTITLWSFSPR